MLSVFISTSVCFVLILWVLLYVIFGPGLSSHFLSSLLSARQTHVAAGSGEPGGDEYHSLVLYHNNSPRWAEQIKLPIPVDMFRGSHVRFEFRHCSSK